MNNNIPDTQPKDAGLREAVARRARRCPQMPAGLNEQLMERVEEMQPQHSSTPHRWMWPSIAACIVAALIVGYSLLGGSSEVAPTASTQGTQVIYASTTDTAYKSPAFVDEFIARLAANYGIEQEPMDSVSAQDANTASFTYVFPDRNRIDVFGRLLQVACWYDNNSPGYQLHISQTQFVFELQDIREGRRYMWFAEKIGGNTFLYGVNAPFGATLSLTGYTNAKANYYYTF